jgi:hypothetical protein
MNMEKNNNKKPKVEGEPKVHPDLEGFNIHINSFGEIVRTHSVEELNKFLDKNVIDKKLKDREEPKPEDDK